MRSEARANASSSVAPTTLPKTISRPPLLVISITLSTVHDEEFFADVRDSAISNVRVPEE